jgi:hypothetical protein
MQNTMKKEFAFFPKRVFRGLKKGDFGFALVLPLLSTA